MQAGSLYVASGIYGVVEAVPHFPDFTTKFTATPLETTSSCFEQIETCVCESGGTGIFVEEPNPEREPHKRPNWALEDVDTGNPTKVYSRGKPNTCV